MCEIVVLDPEQAPIKFADETSYRFHNEQGDGVGALAVYRDGDTFEYETYKSTQPSWATVHNWYERHFDAWRIVIHGRAGTCGGVNRAAAHPIHVDCDECNFDWVVHNGSVRKHKTKRKGMRKDHDLTTEVDSELIAHTVQELPESVDGFDRNTYTLTGNLNYLLFSENGILVRKSRKYHLTEDFKMTCSIRSMESPAEKGFQRKSGIEWLLIEPDADAEDGVAIETEEYASTYRAGNGNRSSRGSRGTGVYGHGSAHRGHGGWSNYEDQRANSDEQTEASESSTTDVGTVRREYDDLTPYYDYIQAIKVAPGVVEVRELPSGETEYVFRRDQPELYYFYVDEEKPANIDQLQAWADEGVKFEHFGDGDLPEQVTGGNDELSDAEKVAAEAAAREVATLTDEISIEEAAEVADEVQQMLAG